MPKKNKAKQFKSRKPDAVVKTTAPRNSPVPKAASLVPAPKVITYEMIAKRAYEIYAGGTGGDEMHNWLRAERELKGL